MNNFETVKDSNGDVYFIANKELMLWHKLEDGWHTACSEEKNKELTELFNDYLIRKVSKD